MFRLVAIIVLTVVVVFAVRAMLASPSRKEKADTGSTDMVEDPNCHTYIPIAEAIRREIQDKEHFFCGEKCAEEYQRFSQKK